MQTRFHHLGDARKRANQPQQCTATTTHHRKAHVLLCVLERESRVKLSVEDELTL